MKRLVVLLAVLGALVVPAASSAHPLGNFTTNHYSRVVGSGDRLYVLYVLDLAEIPTFQAEQRLRDRHEDDAAYAAALVQSIRSGLRLRIDGRPVALQPLRHEIGFPPGVAGLRTTRLEAVFFARPATTGPARLEYRDETFPNRIGWKEIVLQADQGTTIRASSVPARTISDELHSYPRSLLQSPLDVRSASATLVLGSGAGAAPTLTPRAELDRRVSVRATGDGGFASLIAHRNLGPGFVLLSLAIAFFWGAAHAFSPGHGKSVVAAYLVGARGTPRHAVTLGLTVTVTHTIGVFALGLVTLSLSQFILPDELYPWLNLVSALLIVGVGIAILRWRLRDWLASRGARADAHPHHHGHDHHGHDHRHDPSALRLRNLIGIGVSGGIIPCPTALVVLLAAIALHRVGYGLVLIVAFSLGLAVAMTGIGLVAVTAKRVFSRIDFDSGPIRLLPALSALVVLGLGIAMTVRAIPKVH